MQVESNTGNAAQLLVERFVPAVGLERFEVGTVGSRGDADDLAVGDPGANAFDQLGVTQHRVGLTRNAATHSPPTSKRA